MANGTRTYGVKLVRGPFVELPPHEESCVDEADLAQLCRRIRDSEPDRFLAADLFSGAGGLSLGLEQAGMRVVLSVDHDKEAVETHRHHFPGLTVDWDLADPEMVERVGTILAENGIEVLAGGPPCQPFSKAGRSLIRHQVRTGQRESHDHRRDLWRSYLEIIRLARPKAVIMENVPDMALDKEMFILRTMALELEQMNYGVEVEVVDTWRYGVPQFRQRLMLVAIADSRRFHWPEPVSTPVSLDDAISDLPAIEGGWRPTGGADGWADYAGPLTTFQRAMRAGVKPSQSARVYDHITRPVREDDRQAFALMDSNTRYSDLPEGLKRYRDDIFDDKYKRLDGDDLSRTITAHIAKDGYWYIHPREDRTISVREAARIQTFPDWFRFAGPPSAAFQQIGNAVPPRAGAALGDAVLRGLAGPPGAASATEGLSGVLANWFRDLEMPSIPWLKASTRWQVISAERLLDRASASAVRSVWPILERNGSPRDTLASAQEIVTIGDWMDRKGRAISLLDLAQSLADLLEDGTLGDAHLESLVADKQISRAHADVAALVVGEREADSSEEPILTGKGVLRVAARFSGKPVDLTNRLTDGRITVARMVGFGADARDAHLALMELANSLCRPQDPLCTDCPLSANCASSMAAVQARNMLPGVLALNEPQGSTHLR